MSLPEMSAELEEHLAVARDSAKSAPVQTVIGRLHDLCLLSVDAHLTGVRQKASDAEMRRMIAIFQDYMSICNSVAARDGLTVEQADNLKVFVDHTRERVASVTESLERRARGRTSRPATAATSIQSLTHLLTRPW